MKKYNYYNGHLRNYAKEHRKGMTKSEACLWKFVLSRQQMMGYKFRRQRPILRYIADFACLRLKLIIEVDGGYHSAPHVQERDRLRDETLASLGYTTLRFSNRDVLERIDVVYGIIAEWIVENGGCPPPSPRQRGIKKR